MRHLIPLAALLLLAPQALAQDVVEPAGTLRLALSGDGALKVERVLAVGETAINRSFSVAYEGTGGPALRWLAEDLLRAEGGPEVDRGEVRIEGGLALTNRSPIDVRLVVGGLSRPGTYRGNLTLFHENQTSAEGVVLPVEIRIRRLPELRPLTEQPLAKIQQVNCMEGIRVDLGKLGQHDLSPDCALAHWLLSTHVQRHAGIPLENPTDGEVVVTGVDALVFSTSLTALPGETTINGTFEDPVVPKGVGTLRVEFEGGGLPPGQYGGRLLVHMRDGTTPAAIPAEIKVRDGPLFPFFLLLFGMLFGWLARRVATHYAPRRKAFSRLIRVEALMHQVLGATDQARLQGELRELERKVQTFLHEAAKDGIDALESKVDALVMLERLEDLAEGTGVGVLDKIVAIRNKIHANELGPAKVDMAELQRNWPAAPGKAAILMAAFHMAIADASALEMMKGEAAREEEEAAKHKWRLRRARARDWLLEHVAYVGLALLIGAYGLKLLYVDTGDTFGADRLGDAFEVFLWGFVVDVSSGTLAGFAKPKT